MQGRPHAQGARKSWLTCQHQALLRSPLLWALPRKQLLSGGTGGRSSCPPALCMGELQREGRAPSPKPGQAKFNHSRVLCDHRAPPAAAFSFSAKPPVSQRQRILTSLLFPGSLLSLWEESLTQKEHRRDRFRAELDPWSPPASSADLDSHHGKMLVLKPSFSQLPTDQGKEKREQLLMCWILLSLACSHYKPSQSPVTTPSVSQPFPLPLLGLGRGEIQHPMRSQEPGELSPAQDVDVLLRCCWDLCLPKPFIPPDTVTATKALMPLCPWAQGSSWQLGLGSSRGW